MTKILIILGQRNFIHGLEKIIYTNLMDLQIMNMVHFTELLLPVVVLLDCILICVKLLD